MAILKKPYEISIWEDVLVENGDNKSFKESKIAIIGSNTMTTPNRAFSPVLHKNVNGEISLTFSMAYTYFDPEAQAEVINPFINFLINERKVKLKYDGQWYDFLIKTHEEDSESMIWTYTAVDAFVNELSKIGYNIEFNTELGNNQGTAIELAQETLKNTDWTVDVADSSTLQQTIDDPLYRMRVTGSSLTVLNVDTNREISVAVDETIYVFYSQIVNQQKQYIQFLREADRENWIYDDQNSIIGTNYRILNNAIYNFSSSEPPELVSLTIGNTTLLMEGLYTEYHGYRVVYGQLTTYDPVMQRTVEVYKSSQQNVNKRIFKYTDFEYTTSDVITSYITNGSNFNAYSDGSLQGWSNGVFSTVKEGGISKLPHLSLTTYPKVSDSTSLIPITQFADIKGYLEFQLNAVSTNNNYRSAIFNSGIENNTYIINNIVQGEEYALRAAAAYAESEHGTLIPYNMSGNTTKGLRAVVAYYTEETESNDNKIQYVNKIDTSRIIFDFTGAFTKNNLIIKGGTFSSDNKTYFIDGVAQEPSSRYIYEDTSGVQKVWDGDNSNFTTSLANFINSYITTATAKRAVSNQELSDYTTKIGIFLYTKDSTLVGADKYIYLSDIELTRCVRDANGEIVTTGNIPTATTHTTDNYYLEPDLTANKESISTYWSLEDLASANNYNVNLIKPVYNEEKILSISEAQSNCFNILQSICETFECWLKINVEHDENGAITLDRETMKPIKKIALKEYAGKDNWAGFKYGINLNSIQRTINSEEIVTKLIVDNVQNDNVDSGVMSIRNAKSNPSGEAYILNFNYYFNKQLINNVDNARKDLDEYYTQMKQYNVQLDTLRAEQNKIENSLVKIIAKRNVFTELVDTAKDTYNEKNNEFEKLVGISYDKYVREYDTVKDWTGDETDCETIVQTIGELYTAASVINTYSGVLTNINEEYKEQLLKSRGAEDFSFTTSMISSNGEYITKVIVSDYLDGFRFALYNSDNESGTKVEFTTSVSQKVFDVQNVTPYNRIKVIAIPARYHLSGININQAKAITAGIQSYEILPDVVYKKANPGYRGRIEEIQNTKDALEKSFYGRYSTYIREGTWSSNEYIDPERYYLDAVQVSNTSAMPKIEYSINVAEVSELEGLENYLFDVGDKSYIEDTEFFGWASYYINKQTGEITRTAPAQADLSLYDHHKMPAREEIIVSQVEWHLDEPENNVITVQNYKTQFEDLFQRINAAVQTVQYNEATYAKTASILDANGTINQNLLLASLNSIGGNTYTLTSDGSIKIDKDCISITDLNNPLKRLKLNSNGLMISSDGGITWSTAIDGNGININKVITGTLNTREILIMDGDQPSFRWDKAGISAYEYTGIQDRPYNLRKFVRFDRFGLYGVKDGENYQYNSLDDIKEKAHFGITWDGFFIKNSYAGGGRVEITSDNDFRVLSDPSQQSNFQEKIKIGALEWGRRESHGEYFPITDPTASGATELPTLYGIRIKNDAGAEVFKTGDNGDIEITGTLNATAGNFSGIVNVGPKNQDHIIIDGRSVGNSPSIASSNYQDGAGYGWMINKDGDAVFNNITARGAIKTAVFEYAEIQAVGGIFLFRPSSTIKSAFLRGDDLVVVVEKPLLFAKVTYAPTTDTTVNSSKTYYEFNDYGYSEVENPTGNPSARGYYEKTEINNGSWCKVSNYTGDGNEPQADVRNILLTNGLTHVYQVSNVNVTSGEVTLNGGKAFVDALKEADTQDAIAAVLKELEGGALIDMGRSDGSTNYGIGVNSSDNTVNLPRRAISLFETAIDETKNPKVSYEYRGVLGTLPVLQYTGANKQVSKYYHDYLEDTQGIYTDNMYIGDGSQYIAFYTDGNGKKHLRISAQELIFEEDEEGGTETTYADKIEQIESDTLQISVHSTIGDTLVGGQGRGALFVKCMSGGDDVDYIPLNVQSGDTLPAGQNGDYFILLSGTGTNGTAILKKNVNGTWTTVTPRCTYTWTYRDKNGNVATTGIPATSGQCVYIDGDLVDKKLTADVAVVLNE